MQVTISSTVIAQIVAEMRGAPAREVCGLLFGDGTDIQSAQACANVATDLARTFEIDPAALIAAHRTARAGGPAVIGHYHSHPNGLAEPSARDAADASPDGSLWLIAAASDVRGWRAVRDGAVHGRFDPVTLVSLAPCAADSASSEDAIDTKDFE
jgi:desampylase